MSGDRTGCGSSRCLATAYKKGYEVRLHANSGTELAGLQDLLVAAGFTSGKPWSHVTGFRVPIYGRSQVERFLDMVDAWDRNIEITPRVRALRGVLAGCSLDEDDYRRHLEEKYR